MSKSHDNIITVLIEIPKGSRNKYEFDKERHLIKFDRMLYSPVHYPADYGFILDTLADDGDPLDALVLVWEPTYPGVIIDARPVGILKMWDEKGSDEKVLCVPEKDPLWNHITDLSQIQSHLLKEIEHFFTVYKTLENKEVGVEGWKGKDEALKLIEHCRQKYAESNPDIDRCIRPLL